MPTPKFHFTLSDQIEDERCGVEGVAMWNLMSTFNSGQCNGLLRSGVHAHQSHDCGNDNFEM